jgi:co-chaperonin GroES (HSP10)
MSEGVRIEPRRTEIFGKRDRIRPLRDHILVKPLDWKPSSVLYVANQGRKPLRGIVVSVGPGLYPKRYNRDRSKTWDSRVFRRCEVIPGDCVELGGLEINGYSFPEILIDNVVHLIAREEDVCGIVTD